MTYLGMLGQVAAVCFQAHRFELMAPQEATSGSKATLPEPPSGSAAQHAVPSGSGAQLGGTSARANDGKRLWFLVTVRDRTGKLTLYIPNAALLALRGCADADPFEATFVAGNI